MAEIMRAQQAAGIRSNAPFPAAAVSVSSSRYMNRSLSHSRDTDSIDITGGEEADMENDEEFVSEIWRPYECHSLDFGRPHPGSIVEAAALAAIRLPKHSYPLQESLAQQIEDGSLSSMQLEGVMYACERHARLLPDGHRRAGFFVGDSAGVGKGRQMAGIIVDNLVRGRPRHAWLSASKDLHLDATRDLRDIGCNIPVIDSIAGLEKFAGREGIVFSTYSGLVSKSKTRRFDQLIKWLCNGKSRADYDGVIVLDECHKAKNYFEGSKSKATTETGRHVVLLQDELPSARFVYSSATGISSVEGTGYLTRLGLWGPNTTFASFGQFSETFGNSKSGVSALEMLAMDFKSTGFLVARNVGYAGAEFNVIQAVLTPADAKMYRGATMLWRDVHALLAPMFKLCTKPVEDMHPERTFCGKGKSPGSQLSTIVKLYWSAHQRFFKQLCMTLKIPQLVKEARAALENNMCVVIGLQTTGEAAVGRAQEEAAAIEDEDDYGAFFDESDDEEDFIGDEEEEEEDDEDAMEEEDEEDEDAAARKRPKAKKATVKKPAVFAKNTANKKPASSKKNDRLELKDSRGRLVSVCRSILENFLVKHFPCRRLWTLATDDPEEYPYEPPKMDLVVLLALIARNVPGVDANMLIRCTHEYFDHPGSIHDMDGVPYYDAFGYVYECERERNKLLKRLSALDLPAAALDDLIDRLGGPSKVAEMTGRAHRQVRLPDGTVAIEPRTKMTTQNIELTMDSLNVMEKTAFMSGQKLVAIISEAASTGISLHSDRNVANQRRRVHCTLELPWAADQAIQQLGRSHRTNQSSAPIYRLVSSGLGGESRFVSSVSRRLESLGALTQGDRRASMGAMSLGGEVNLEGKYGVEACKLMYESIIHKTLPKGVSWEAVVKDTLDMMALDAERVDVFGRPGGEDDWCPPPSQAIESETKFFEILSACAEFTAGFQWTFDSLSSAETRDRAKLLPHYRDAHRYSYAAHQERRLAPPDKSKGHLNVPRFLNRLLGLPFAQQSLMFNFFNHTMNSLIMAAKKEGKYDQGLKKIAGRSIARSAPKEELYRDPNTGGRMYLHHLTNDRGMTFEEAMRELVYQGEVVRNSRARRDAIPLAKGPITQDEFEAAMLAVSSLEGGFYFSQREVLGERLIRLAWKTDRRDLYKIVTPATGLTVFTMMTREDFEGKYVRISNFKTAMDAWNRAAETAKTICAHGVNCKARREVGLCLFGLRCIPVNVITGSIIPLWSKLEGVLAQAKQDQRLMRIVQVDLPSDNNETEHLVGLNWPADRVKALKEMLQNVKQEHSRLKERVVIKDYPVINVPVKPGAETQNYNERMRLMDQFNQWLYSPVEIDTMEVLGFAIDAQFAVTQVKHSEPASNAERLGVRVGMRLVQVNAQDPLRSMYNSLKRLIASSMSPQSTIREMHFLLPQEDLEPARHGRLAEVPAPVCPDVVQRLIRRPSELWENAELEKKVKAPARRSGRAFAFSSSVVSSRRSSAVSDGDALDEEAEAEESDSEPPVHPSCAPKASKRLVAAVMETNSDSDVQIVDAPPQASKSANAKGGPVEVVVIDSSDESELDETTVKKPKLDVGGASAVSDSERASASNGQPPAAKPAAQAAAERNPKKPVERNLAGRPKRAAAAKVIFNADAFGSDEEGEGVDEDEEEEEDEEEDEGEDEE